MFSSTLAQGGFVQRRQLGSLEETQWKCQTCLKKYANYYAQTGVVVRHAQHGKNRNKRQVITTPDPTPRMYNMAPIC